VKVGVEGKKKKTRERGGRSFKEEGATEKNLLESPKNTQNQEKS